MILIPERVTNIDHLEIESGAVGLKDQMDGLRNLLPSCILPAVSTFGQAGQSCDCDPVLLGSVQLPVTELSINGGLDVDATLELTVTIL